MEIKIEEKKQKALELLQKLDVYKPYIKGFRERNEVCMFERFAGFWAYQYPELMQKIEEIEKRYNCLVYAITHEYAEFGELYDFLIVTDYKEEWDYLLEDYGIDHCAFAYVWNKDDPDLSELGTIVIKSAFGGLIRKA